MHSCYQRPDQRPSESRFESSIARKRRFGPEREEGGTEWHPPTNQPKPAGTSTAHCLPLTDRPTAALLPNRRGSTRKHKKIESHQSGGGTNEAATSRQLIQSSLEDDGENRHAASVDGHKQTADKI